MNFLHTRTYIIGRSGGTKSTKAAAYRSGSIVAAAAYRSNNKLKNEIDGKVHDYTRKRGVVFSKIFLPAETTKEFSDRSTLWNAVERIEKRKDSQLARQWEAGLPKEFSREDQIDLMSKFVEDYFISQGMIADVAIHDKGDGNPHVHVLLTLRRSDENGFLPKKERLWNDRKLAQLWRVAWADRCNVIYKKLDLPIRIDPRSYEIQGNGLEPTKPIGKAANQLEKRGIATAAGNENRAIIARNQEKMRYILYDIMTQPEVDQPLYNQVQQPKEETKMPPARSREQLLIDLEELPEEIREQKATLSLLKDFKVAFSDFESRLARAHENNESFKIKNIEQSIYEAKENMMEKVGIELSSLDACIYRYNEVINTNQAYFDNIPNLLREWDELENVEVENDKIIRPQFGQRTEEMELEDELEDEPEREV